MNVNFDKEFRREKDDKTYKGVHLRAWGHQRGSNGTKRVYSFSAWSPQQFSGKWMERSPGPVTLGEAQRLIKGYVEQGYTIHPNGHLRAPGWKDPK